MPEVELKFRELDQSDMKDLFEWRNHPEIRKNSFSSDPILWGEHKKWFKTKLNDENTAFYISSHKDNKIGSIRFESNSDIIKISIMLNPEYLGKGFGHKIIKLGVKKFIKEKTPNKSLIAEIKCDNIASIKAFLKAKFKESYKTYVYEVNDENVDNYVLQDKNN